MVLRNHLAVLFFNAKREDISPITDEDSAWLEGLGEQFYKAFTPLTVSTNMEILEKYLTKIQPLTILITFDISETEINNIGIWLRSNISSSIVFETKVDPTLIAGAAFTWKGVYHDYSIQKTINQNKEQVLESIKSYLK